MASGDGLGRLQSVTMHRLNKVITVLLALAAVAAWVVTAVAPGTFTLSYPSVQAPMAVTLSAAACFGWLLLWLSERRRDTETRCRKCGYILRGLSEPRCSECGERI